MLDLYQACKGVDYLDLQTKSVALQGDQTMTLEQALPDICDEKWNGAQGQARSFGEKSVSAASELLKPPNTYWTADMRRCTRVCTQIRRCKSG